MKKSILKMMAISVLLIVAVAIFASCDIDIAISVPNGGTGCSHTNVTKGSCIEYPTCQSCGKKVGDYKAHDYVTNVKEATCLKDGYTESVCKVCNDTKKSNVTPAVGHSFGAWIVVTEPTVDQAGSMRRECSSCGWGEVLSLLPHEHSFESVDAKPVTCTTDGWDAYQYCTECNYDTKVVIKALGHAYGEYESLGNGNHKQVCANDPAHVLTEPCSGGSSSGSSLPICEYCNTEYELAARPGNSTYGYYALGEYTSGEGMQLLYKSMITVCEEFFVSADDVSPDGEYYVIGEFDLDDYSLSLDEGMAVWKVFYVSNPAYYWLDASVVSRGSDTLILTIDAEYASASRRQTCDTAIEKMASDCALLIKDGMSDLEKAMAITAYIVANMEYAYESDGVTPEGDMWAHNMTGLAVHGWGVCEAYAKSFMYLCLLNDVECIMGSGFGGGEAHAWNYVKLGEEWYGADITWTDNSGDNVVYDKLGLSDATLYRDHVSHSSTNLGVQFIYKAPELATKDIELTALYKDGEKVGIYKSIDEAFAVMTDSEAEYMIDIGYYSSFVGATTHTIKATETPSVKKLTIKGKNEYVGEDYLDNNSIINMRSGLTLNSDVELQDIHTVIYDGVGICPINVGKNTLTLGGSSVYLDNRILASDSESLLVSTTERGAHVYGGIDAYKLITTNGITVVGADSHFVYASTDNLFRQNGAKISIDNYT